MRELLKSELDQICGGMRPTRARPARAGGGLPPIVPENGPPDDTLWDMNYNIWNTGGISSQPIDIFTSSNIPGTTISLKGVLDTSADTVDITATDNATGVYAETGVNLSSGNLNWQLGLNVNNGNWTFNGNVYGTTHSMTGFGGSATYHFPQ